MTSPDGRRAVATGWVRLRSNVRRRYEGSVVEDLRLRAKRLSFVDTITAFGAVFLLSALPFAILVGSFAGRRIENDLTSHMGLNTRASHIVGQLFAASRARSVVAVTLAGVIGFAGVIGVAGSMQNVYQRIFGVSQHGGTNIVRLIAWAIGFCGWLGLASAIDAAAKGLPIGTAVEALVVWLETAAFFWWSMHMLLGGAVAWRSLAVPAAVTAVFWIGLEGFAALYFSSTIISDSKLYGTIGVVFSLLTWFIAIAAVLVLGALVGDVVQVRAGSRRRHKVRGPSTSEKAKTPIKVGGKRTP